MRISNWISPVYARLQRRFVRFSSGSVEEKVEELFSAAFDRLVDSISMEVKPRYSLSVQSSVTDAPYAPTELTSFIIKLLRNSISCCQDVTSLEAKVLRGIRSYISNRMKPLGKPLERLYSTRGPTLTAKETQLVEDMLNLGHSSLAAVFAQWQIRYTLVGLPDPAEPKKFVKDFLRPVRLGEPANVLNSLPKDLRDECGFKVEEVADRLKPSVQLRAVALLAHAVRESAATDFRALISYDSSLDDMPTSRDAVYTGTLSVCPLASFIFVHFTLCPLAVLSSVLLEALAGESFSLEGLYENLLACCALEETIGTKEPRASCAEAYTTALTYAAVRFMTSNSAPPPDIRARVKEMERALGMVKPASRYQSELIQLLSRTVNHLSLL